MTDKFQFVGDGTIPSVNVDHHWQRGNFSICYCVHLSTSIKFLDFRNKLAREHFCVYQSILYACVSHQLLKCINIYSTGNCSHGECMPIGVESK